MGFSLTASFEIIRLRKPPKSCVLDEVDILRSMREAGLHEATRRILSMLLRKIDSFESEGEVLVICATNRNKDLDPALVSRLDLSIRFELPDTSTRAAIFQHYAKPLSSDDLQQIGDLAFNLSGRDIADICEDAEKEWASKYIRKEVSTITPTIGIYTEVIKLRWPRSLKWALHWSRATRLPQYPRLAYAGQSNLNFVSDGQLAPNNHFQHLRAHHPC